MEQFALSVRLREAAGTGTARQCRRDGFIPAVVYGHGQQVSSIAVPAKEFGLLLRHHGGGHVIDLVIEGLDQVTDMAVLLKEMQRDPVTREIVGLDFQWVSMKEVVQVNVPVTLLGEAFGVTQEGGSLEQVLFEISVSCLPGAIPQSLAVDVSELRMGHSIHVADLTAPEGIEILASPEDTVVNVSRAISAEDLGSRPEEEAGVAAEGETTADESTGD
jgi:large subunit ribosomal protein L25